MFLALDGLQLVEYIEPLLQAKIVGVSESILNRLLLDLPSYDEYHLVYALLLGSSLSPKAFIEYIPKQLSHKKDSVKSTALNILDRLPDELITIKLLASVRAVVASDGSNPIARDALDKLEVRWRAIAY